MRTCNKWLPEGEPAKAAPSSRVWANCSRTDGCRDTGRIKVREGQDNISVSRKTRRPGHLEAR